MTDNPRALSIKETEGALGISRATVMRLIANGELRAVRAGERYLIPVDSIDAYLNSDEK